MQKNQEYLTVAGLFAFVGVCILLFSSPEDIFSSLMIIDVSKTYKTPYEMLVSTVYDFKKADELRLLPTKISNLTSRDLDYTKTEERMGAMLKRMYSGENESVLLIILSSQNMTEFHNLEICYSGSWNITEKDVIEIKAEKFGEAGVSSIHVNRFLVQRGDIRMVVLHWFMWNGGILRTDKNFMLIEVGAMVEEEEGGTEKTDALTQRFTKDFFQTIYKPVKRSPPIAVQMTEKYGLAGYAINAALILIPLAMIFNARLFGRRQDAPAKGAGVRRQK